MIIVSIGGNALIRRGETGTIEEQFSNADSACEVIAALSSNGAGIIITHGNGPVVGNIVIKNEAAKNILPPMPLYVCDADSEGEIGFVIQQALYNRLHAIHKIQDVVTVVTQTVVDPQDPAFKNPAKPIGPYYTAEEARVLAEQKGWAVVQDSFRGFRRVVPSPRPVRIVEADVIKRMAGSGIIVIAAGGGGVPVVESPDGTLHGIDAVVDKDLATSLLARQTGAQIFINLTQIDRVYLDYGTADEKGCAELGVEDAKKYLAQGQFAPGSMGPKIEAAIEFLEHGGAEVLITAPELLSEALKGRAGTRIFK